MTTAPQLPASTAPDRRWRRRAALLAASVAATSLATIAPTGAAFADSFVVTTTADSGPGSLRQAIIDSNNAFGLDDISIDLPAGSTIALESDLPSVNEDLVVKALAGDITVDGVGSHRGFVASGDLTLTGFTMHKMVVASPTFGSAVAGSGSTIRLVDMTFSASNRSAVSVDAGSLLVEDSTFNDNSGDTGGAIRFAAQNTAANTLSVTSTTFVDNVANGGSLGGGAIAMAAGGIGIVTDATFESNQAANQGGAIRAVDANLTITDSTFAENTGQSGAAIALDVIDGSPFSLPGVATISDSDFAGNIASQSGGGLDVDEHTVTLERITFADNGAQFGGALRLDAAEATVDGTTFSGNSASSAGGAIELTGVAPGAGVLTSLTMTNSTASGNTTAGDGAVLHGNTRSAATIRHSTITANSAGTGGGATASDGPLTIDHSILASNSSLAGAADIQGTVTSLTWSLLGDSSGATLASAANNLLDVDPELEPIADNGGPTATLRPAPGSPVIDAGNPAFGGAPSIDQRGLARVGSGRIDIGSLETNQGTLSVVASAGEVSEGGDVTFTVSRDGGADGAASVDLIASGGSATPGVDHDALDETFTWGDGDSSVRTVTVAIDEDVADDVDETLVATLTDASGATIGAPSTATVTIVNVPTPFIVPVSPARLVDTRTTGETIDGRFEGEGRRVADSTLTLEVNGRAGVPADATAVVMNITAVRPSGTGYVTAYPCDADRPQASSLNYSTGQNLGNEIIARVSAAGTVCLYTFGEIDMTADAVGYVPANSPYRPQTPARLMDTRIGAQTIDGDFSSDGVRPADTQFVLRVTGRNGVPAGAAAAVVNITAVNPQGSGFVTAHPCEDERPVTSALNYVGGVTRGNEIVAKLSPNGELCLYNSAATHLTVDIVGWLPVAASFTPVAPGRFVDSRAGQTTVDGRLEGFGALAAGDSLRIKIAGRDAVPNEATAAVINIAAIRPAATGYFTVWNCEGDPPLASSLNYVSGVNGSSEIIAGLNDIGELCVFTPTTTDLAIDVVGFAS